MYYCDRNGSRWGDRDHQMLEVVLPGKTITSQPVACSSGLNGLLAAAQQLAAEQ